jgi:hypothetical protein
VTNTMWKGDVLISLTCAEFIHSGDHRISFRPGFRTVGVASGAFDSFDGVVHLEGLETIDP